MKTKISVLFSGQGAQTPGMMKDLCNAFDLSRTVFNEADRQLNRSISDLAFYGSQEQLNLTQNTQPCVLAADLAAYAALKESEICGDAVAGFSLGEYGALVAAECIDITDVFSLIQKRANYMQEAVPIGEGAMAAIGGKSLDEVQELCDQVQGYVVPANINCPGQIVISGSSQAVHDVVTMASQQKIKAMILPVSAPFHCELLKEAADRLSSALEHVSIKDPHLPVYMNYDGEIEQDSSSIRSKLFLQTKSPVLWMNTLQNMYRDGYRIFIECGPGKTLSGFVKKTFKGFDDVASLRVSDLETLSATVAYIKENT